MLKIRHRRTKVVTVNAYPKIELNADLHKCSTIKNMGRGQREASNKIAKIVFQRLEKFF